MEQHNKINRMFALKYLTPSATVFASAVSAVILAAFAVGVGIGMDFGRSMFS